MKTYGVIMAGGGGTRFWPLSRRANPKQFLNLSGKDTMVMDTANRLCRIADKEDIFIVTGADFVESTVKSTEKRLRADHILGEPAARNSAACIGYAAMEIVKKYEDGVMCVAASDHFIKDEDEYERVMKTAISLATEKDALVTIGIKPTFPSTGYGYIKSNRETQADYYAVEEFVEKPDLDTAKEYLASGEYAWNSGMFVWKVSSIVENFRQHLPQVHKLYGQILDSTDKPESERVLTEAYKGIDSVSIDFGVMEHADKIYTIPGNFGWDDVGSWLALERINQTNELGNVVKGDVITIDTNNSIIVGGSKLIAVVGMNDIVVVDTEDATLICAKDSTQDIKKVIENIKICNRRDVM